MHIHIRKNDFHLLSRVTWSEEIVLLFILLLIHFHAFQVTENFREIGMLGLTFFWRCRTRRPLSLGAAEAAPKAPMARGSAPMPQAHNSCTEGPLYQRFPFRSLNNLYLRRPREALPCSELIQRTSSPIVYSASFPVIISLSLVTIVPIIPKVEPAFLDASVHCLEGFALLCIITLDALHPFHMRTRCTSFPCAYTYI